MPQIPERPQRNELQAARTELFGDLCSVMSVNPHHKHRPMSVMADIFFPAFRHGQCRVFYNDVAQPVGFVVWAQVDDDAHERFIRTLSLRLHISEWNDGTNLWILDFAAAPEAMRLVISACCEMFAGHAEAYFSKINGQRVTLRAISSGDINRLVSRWRG
jgi:hemolysin-activating ACP:hemolysin acyltransferase